MKIRLSSPRLTHKFASILVIGLAILGRVVAADYAVGAKIEVQWAGDNKWYKAEILEFTEGQYKVRYEADGIIAYYKPERMRSLPGAAQPQPQRQPQAATMRQENGVTPNLSISQNHLPAAKLPA